MTDWIDLDTALEIHTDMIGRYGGAAGLRDPNLLTSALARPQNLAAYADESDLCEIAAAYGFGIAKNHPFIDGNKRTAFASMVVFLRLNGMRLIAEQPDATKMMLGVAAGESSEADLANWLRNNTMASEPL